VVAAMAVPLDVRARALELAGKYAQLAPLGIDLEDLPPEMFAHIASFITLEEARTLLAVSRAWREQFGPPLAHVLLKRDVLWLRGHVWPVHPEDEDLPANIRRPVDIHPEMQQLLVDEAAVNWRRIDADAAFLLYDRALDITARAIGTELAHLVQFYRAQPSMYDILRLNLHVELVSSRYRYTDVIHHEDLSNGKHLFKFHADIKLHMDDYVPMDFLIGPGKRTGNVDGEIDDLNAVLRQADVTHEELFAVFRAFVYAVLSRLDPSIMLEVRPMQEVRPMLHTRGVNVLEQYLQAYRNDDGREFVDSSKAIYKGLATGNVRTNATQLYHM
jgi:hypothetical protein